MSWLSIENLEYQSIDKEFKLKLNNLSFHENTSLIYGSNGIGKTTFFKLILNNLKSKKGSLLLSKQIKTIVHIDQELSLIDFLTVKENCKLQVSLKGNLNNKNEFEKQFNYFIESLNLNTHQHKTINKLSMGQAQRALILKSLMVRPDLILADEPTSFQDPIMKQKVIELLLSYCKDNNAKLIMISHDHDIKSRFDTIVNFDHLLSDNIEYTHNATNINKTAVAI